MSKRKVLSIFFGVIILSSIFLVDFFRGKYVVPILMYHSVNPGATPENMLAISAATFERQMHFLSSHRYNVLPLESIAALVKERKKIPYNTVAITLDDGYKDAYTYAFPVLKKYNLPATMFIITDEVGRADRLSWDEIKKMQAAAIITFGSHTLGPEPLINIKSGQEIKRQVFDSKKILEEKLGCKVNTFSYPEGMFTRMIKQLVMDAGYTLAVATNPGKKSANDDVFALKRLRISANCNNLFIFWIETSGYYNFMREHRHKK